MQNAATLHERNGFIGRRIRLGIGLLVATIASVAQAEIDPAERADKWWDASRAERIGFSDRAASACKSRNCDSLQIRSCLNDTLKPAALNAMRGKSLAEATASCIAGLKAAK